MARRRNPLADLIEDARERHVLAQLLPLLADVDAALPGLCRAAFAAVAGGDPAPLAALADRFEAIGRPDLATQARSMLAAARRRRT